MSLIRSAIADLFLIVMMTFLPSCRHHHLINVPITNFQSTGEGRIYIVSDGPNGPRGWLVHAPSLSSDVLAAELKDLTKERSAQLYHLDRSIRNRHMDDTQIIFMNYDWLPRRSVQGNVLIDRDSMVKLVHVRADRENGMARTFILLFVLAGIAGTIIVLK